MSADGDIVRDGLNTIPWMADTIPRKQAALAALARLEAAEAILHPKDEEHLGQLVAALRSQVELDEGGYCVLCEMHYTDQETLAHDRMRANAAEAKRDALARALRTICDIGETRDVEVARAALAEAGLG